VTTHSIHFATKVVTEHRKHTVFDNLSIPVIDFIQLFVNCQHDSIVCSLFKKFENDLDTCRPLW
jgi:hypothetical protein